jgi:hypothetical protein
MRHHQTNQIGRALVGVSVLLAGCAADVAGSDPAPKATQESVAQSSSADTALRIENAGEHCSPRTCCFPSAGGGWQDNPLENDLQSIGCTTPSPYEQKANAFWVWTRCPLSFQTLEAVYKFRGTPYDARFVENACLGYEPDKVVVVFDPTCGTCNLQ